MNAMPKWWADISIQVASTAASALSIARRIDPPSWRTDAGTTAEILLGLGELRAALSLGIVGAQRRRGYWRCFVDVPDNDPAKAGELASPKRFAGSARYAFAPVHTRFGAVQWFLWDAETTDQDGDSPALVGQFDKISQLAARLREFEAAPSGEV